MALTRWPDQAAVPPPSYQRTLASALHLDALTLVTRLQLLAVCRVAVHLAHQQCPPPLRAGPGGAPRLYAHESLLQLLAVCRVAVHLAHQQCPPPLRAGPGGAPRLYA